MQLYSRPMSDCSILQSIVYPISHMSRVWIRRLLFVVCLIFVCMYGSAEDKASGVKFCTAVHRRPRQGIANFCELCSPRSPSHSDVLFIVPYIDMRRRKRHANAKDAPFVKYRATCGRRIGVCGLYRGQSPLMYLLLTMFYTTIRNYRMIFANLAYVLAILCLSIV